MGRSQESFHKKQVRKRKEKKRKDKEEKRKARKEHDPKSTLDDMIAYVDEYGNITATPPDPAGKDEVKANDIEIGIPARDPDYDDGSARTGVLTYLKDSKGYGFIRDSITKENIFVHKNNFQDELHEGDTVSFDVDRGPKGLSAINVKTRLR